jgi:hypothetical protein
MTLKAKILLLDVIMWAMLALWMALLYHGEVGWMMIVGAVMIVPFGFMMRYERQLQASVKTS